MAQREEWRQLTAGLDLSRLVFVDETGAKTNMTRSHGRAEGGRRVVDAAPHGHWGTTTLLSSIRLDGSTAPTRHSPCRPRIEFSGRTAA